MVVLVNEVVHARRHEGFYLSELFVYRPPESWEVGRTSQAGF